jgi:excisionase family DNA binding protein
MGIFFNDSKEEKAEDNTREQFLTVKETCEMLKVTDETLRRWEKRGRLTSYSLPSTDGERTRPVDFRGKRYKLSEINALLRRNP